MSGIKSEHSRLTEKAIAEYRQDLVASLANGVPQDYPAYRQLVGQIQGIDKALQFSGEADSKLSGDEPDART